MGRLLYLFRADGPWRGMRLSLTRALSRMSGHARKRPKPRLHSLKPARTPSTWNSKTGSSSTLSASRRSGRSDQVRASSLTWLFASEREASPARFAHALSPNRSCRTSWQRDLRVRGLLASALTNFLTIHNIT